MAPAQHRVRPPAPNQTELPGEDELPYDFGPNLETEQHRITLTELISALRDWLRFKGVRDTYVNGNMAIYFSAAQIMHNDFLGPDVFVVKETSLRKRKSWVCWHENRSPDVVIELLSDSTERRDRGEKMRIYAKVLRVHEYFLFDPLDGRLEGYRLDPRHRTYVVIPPDADDLLECQQLGLQLGVRWQTDEEDFEEPQLRWKEPSGDWLPTPEERAEAEQKRAEAEQKRAEAEQGRAERLAAKLRELGIDPDEL